MCKCYFHITVHPEASFTNWPLLGGRGVESHLSWDTVRTETSISEEKNLEIRAKDGSVNNRRNFEISGQRGKRTSCLMPLSV